MTDTAKGEFKKAMHVGRLTADKVQLGTAGGYGWQTYKPTLTGGTLPTTMVANLARYRIVDTTLEVKMDWAFTSNTGGASTAAYTFTLPPGCTVRAPALLSAQQSANGCFSLQSVSSTVIYTGVVILSGTAINVLLSTNGVATVVWGNSSPADTKWTVAGGFQAGLHFFVELDPSSPILGEAPVQLSNGTGSVLSTAYAGSNSGSLITAQYQ